MTSIDTAAHIVYTDKGVTAAYDELILATGSNPIMLPIPGTEKEGVIAFRDIKDTQIMQDVSQKYTKALVIGGGLLGLEAARGLLHLAMNVSVVHIHEYIMERQLDEEASRMLRGELEAQGMKFLLKKQSEALLGKKRVKGLLFADGEMAEADLIVMAVGIKPNVMLARSIGIEVNRGIVVNDYMETSLPGIYAVARHCLRPGSLAV